MNNIQHFFMFCRMRLRLRKYSISLFRIDISKFNISNKSAWLEASHIPCLHRDLFAPS